MKESNLQLAAAQGSIRAAREQLSKLKPSMGAEIPDHREPVHFYMVIEQPDRPRHMPGPSETG